ncbi:MAG TPA: primosomal protein N' [Alphaproteobacteria bacterium]|jgi:primosomal protein N' (replication factor Y)|nr:primosomal protein N' [Alphaproteobacteria bacterium]
MDSASSKSAAKGAPCTRVSVLLPLNLPGPYDYRVPPGLELAAGDVVLVPLGARQLNGVVWGPGSHEVAAARLRDVIARRDVPPLPAELRRFVDWVAAYTLSRPGPVLRMAISVPAALAPPKPRTAYRLGDALPGRMTPARARVLELLAKGPPQTARELAQAAAVGPSVVRGLVDAGSLLPLVLPSEPGFAPPEIERPGVTLTAAQAEAAAVLCQGVADGGFSTTLLDGVPGSGKTEVYLEAVAECLRQGRQALVMLPEIALTAQWLERFERRFGVTPAGWHSDLTQAARRATWRAVALGRASVVVGARSALFLPFPELGLIVVDEEHDGSFKQEDGVIYNARDMAVARAHLGGISVVLASATPSLETVVNVQGGRYGAVHLPERHGGAELPTIAAVDMRAEKLPRERWLSTALRRALSETLEAGEQAMLFLNRRGYAPLTLCRACGHRLECPNCSAWLVEHRRLGRLACHHCGYAAGLPESCPACDASDRFAACGPGVERLAEELAQTLPEARLAIMASDTMTGPQAVAELVARVGAGELDVLVGTQIMAKGHHFPNLTLVGVVDADLGLAGGDLRAAERTYQVLYQVAGRAGRADRPGRALLQTYLPDHPVMAALVSGDRQAFMACESEARESHGMPPFGRLAALIVSGADERRVASSAGELARAGPRGSDTWLLGPAPAPLALLRGRHRWRLLLKAERQVNLQMVVRRWLAAVNLPNSIRVQVDIDPYSFL